MEIFQEAWSVPAVRWFWAIGITLVVAINVGYYFLSWKPYKDRQKKLAEFFEEEVHMTSTD